MLCAEMEAAGNIEPDNATFIFGDCGCASVRSRHCFAAKAHDDEVLGMARKFFMRHDTFCATAAAILSACVCVCVCAPVSGYLCRWPWPDPEPETVPLAKLH